MSLFRIVSDIHLEHWCSGTYTEGDIRTWMKKAVPEAATDKDSVLFLAGDISQYHPQRRYMLEAVASRFKHVVYVAGNHEHWGGKLTEWNPEATELEKLAPNITVARSGTAMNIHQEGEVDSQIRIIAATMWAPYGRDNPVYAAALTGNADCKKIRPDKVRFKCFPKDFQDLYTAELGSIEHFLKENFAAGKDSAVVTHHVPSLRLRLPGLDADPFDDMFMSPHAECFMHEDWAPKFWFFGHTHKSWDIQIGKTRCISNPFGYPGETYQGWTQVKIV